MPAELLNTLQDIADSLRILAAREQRESKPEKAVRLLVEMGPDNVSAIAKAVGVHRSTLYRWPSFSGALERLQAAAHWAQRNPRAVNRDGVLA